MTPEETILKANKAIDLAFLEVSQRRNTRQYAEDVKKKIITRTKLGFGVDPSGKQIKLRPLSESYKQQRAGEIRFFTNKTTKAVFATKNKDYTRVVNLDNTTTKAKSNLTATGLLLRSLSASGKTAQIIVSILKKTYTKSIHRERHSGSQVNTNEVADYVSKIRPFFGLTTPQFNLLFKDIAKEIDRIARLYIER